MRITRSTNRRAQPINRLISSITSKKPAVVRGGSGTIPKGTSHAFRTSRGNEVVRTKKTTKGDWTSQVQAQILAQAARPSPPPALVQPIVYSIEDVKARMETEKLDTNRICIINNTCLKDIITCEPIANYYHQLGYKVIWPVDPALCNLNKHSDYIFFVNNSLFNMSDAKLFINVDGCVVVPLKYASEIIQNSGFLDAAYRLWNMEAKVWKRAAWERDIISETKLYSLLGLRSDEQYNLISPHFNNFAEHVDITAKNGLRDIYVEQIPGFTLLDWGMVIEKATQIHVVSTAILYWIGLLNTIGEVHVYAEPGNPLQIGDLETLEKGYIFHT